MRPENESRKIDKNRKRKRTGIKGNRTLDDQTKLTKVEDDYLEHLFVLVEIFEKKTYPLDKTTPQEMVKNLMDKYGYTRKDLEKQLGSPSRVSEFLSGKRKSTLTMIRNLNKNWGAPLETLI